MSNRLGSLVTSSAVETLSALEADAPVMAAAVRGAVSRIARTMGVASDADLVQVAAIIAPAMLPPSCREDDVTVTGADGSVTTRALSDTAIREVTGAAAGRALRRALSAVIRDRESDGSVAAGSMTDDSIGDGGTYDPRGMASGQSYDPAAPYVTTREDIRDSALASLLPADGIALAGTVTGDYVPADRAQAVFLLSLAQSDAVPGADTLARALAAWVVRTTDVDGAPIPRKGRPLTLTGAYSEAHSVKRNTAAQRAIRATLVAALAGCRTLLTDAVRDPYGDELQRWQRVPRVWSPAARDAAMALVESADAPDPLTDVRTCSAVYHGPASDPGARAVLEDVSPSHATSATLPPAPIGMAHDPDCQCDGTVCAILPVYADRDRDRAVRAYDASMAAGTFGRVATPGRKPGRVGAYGASVPAGSAPAPDPLLV